MPLRVSGKNLDIGESLRRHVLDKVEALVARYFDGKVSGHVVISPEGSAYRTDCSFHLSSGMNLQAEGRAHEPYASFEQAADKIERRLRRYNKRLKEHQAAGDPAASVARGRKVAQFVIEPPDEHEEAPADFSPVVVAEGSQPLKNLSVASAVAELDLTGAPLVVFQHASSERVNVVYRRRDGAIGWLDPH
jgi:ribosomal subunit interface protein